MNRRVIRRFAFALIALLAFAQAGVALAGCFMDRGGMASMATLGDCCSPAPEFQPAAELKNDCLVHCTADLQLSGVSVVLVQAPAAAQLFVLPRVPDHVGARHEPPPPPAPPSRILLHSFLI